MKQNAIQIIRKMNQNDLFTASCSAYPNIFDFKKTFFRLNFLYKDSKKALTSWKIIYWTKDKPQDYLLSIKILKSWFYEQVLKLRIIKPRICKCIYTYSNPCESIFASRNRQFPILYFWLISLQPFFLHKPVLHGKKQITGWQNRKNGFYSNLQYISPLPLSAKWPNICDLGYYTEALTILNWCFSAD